MARLIVPSLPLIVAPMESRSAKILSRAVVSIVSIVTRAHLSTPAQFETKRGTDHFSRQKCFIPLPFLTRKVICPSLGYLSTQTRVSCDVSWTAGTCILQARSGVLCYIG